MTKKIRVRFAPSPTGIPHVGNIRTALFAWLYARHAKGTFIVRIEDTDQERLVAGSLEAILESLSWLGLDIDEGVRNESPNAKVQMPRGERRIEEAGEFGPYFQSKRLAIYKQYAEELIQKGHAYYSFASPEQLDALRAEQSAKKMPPRYDGRFDTQTVDEARERIKAGEQYTVRMRFDRGETTVFHDAIKGSVSVANDTLDDQVLLKSDGFPTYHLASVVDDHLMNISHVIRADEWLASTPKHVLLYRAFGWDEPVWVHLPIILGTDKSKLSKRHGAVSVLAYRDQGFLPDAMANYLAFLGWNPKTDQELFSRALLIDSFDIEKINKNNPIFDIEKLRWMNSKYIQQMDVPALASALSAFDPLMDAAFIDRALPVVHDRLETFGEFQALTEFLKPGELQYEAEMLIPKKSTITAACGMLSKGRVIAEGCDDWYAESLRQTFFDYCDKQGIKKGDLLWPLRVAVTGMERSPDLFDTMAALGKDESMNRIQTAIHKLEK